MSTDFQGILANAIKDIHQLNDSNKHVNDIVTSLQQITNSTADLHREGNRDNLLTILVQVLISIWNYILG